MTSSGLSFKITRCSLGREETVARETGKQGAEGYYNRLREQGANVAEQRA